MVTAFRKKSNLGTVINWPLTLSGCCLCKGSSARVFFFIRNSNVKADASFIIKCALLTPVCELCLRAVNCLYFFCDSKVTGNQGVAPVCLMVGLGMLRVNQVEPEGVQLWWVFLLNSFYFLVLPHCRLFNISFSPDNPDDHQRVKQEEETLCSSLISVNVITLLFLN